MSDEMRRRFNQIYTRPLNKDGKLVFPNDEYWLNNAYERAKIRLAPIDIIPTRVLDVGCGEGGFVGAVIEMFPDCEAYGIDISEVGLEHARKKYPSGKFLQCNAADLPFKDELFDLVFSEGVIHIMDEGSKGAISEIHRILKNGGLFICYVGHSNIEELDLSMFELVNKKCQIFRKI